ncbi:MAG: zinc ribbon domain-containing protein, partial [Verrucomicrobiales bacterium]|nr:zinc ribbon domain-containing protein [Verrucomicrobiales bacterium]
MPIYEFHCEQCGRDSEILVRSTNWQGTTCPHCGSKRLVKQFSVFASGSRAEAEAPACTGSPRSCCACGGG